MVAARIHEQIPALPSGPSKLIRVEHNTEGQVVKMHEAQVDHVRLQELDLPDEPFQALREIRGADGKKYTVPMKEAALNNPDANNILRRDIRMVAFTAFNQMPRTFQGFTSFENSMMPQEEYLRDAAIGIIPKAPSGTEAPQAQTGFEGGTIIKNDLYRMVIKVLGDWIRFDQIGKIRQVSQEMGLAGRMTEEFAVYDYITTTGNYQRNSSSGDNDVGPNTADLTFNASNLRTAMNTIATSKDRKSGAYLGYNADTIIIGPKLLIPVLQLIQSGQLQRASAGDSSAEVTGTGTTNPFLGMLSNVIVSPWFGQATSGWGWALCDSRRAAFKFQTVENFNVYQQSQTVMSEAWLHFDALEMLVRGFFGLGFVDDRAWFYSPADEDATVS